MDSVTVKAPATSANLGAGFDLCGIALERPFDIITVRKAERTAISNIGRFIALDHPEQSVFGAVIGRLRKDFSFKDNFEVRIEKQIRHKGGLGSSAAEAVGIAFGLSELLGLDLSKKEIVHYAAFGEEFIDGSRHLDNVAPCAYGGFTISYCNAPVRIKHISVPEELECLLIVPDRQKLSTRHAREVLPEAIPRQDGLYNNFCLAKLICGFLESDVSLIIESLDDRIVEPARARAGILVGLMELRGMARQHGYGAVASGAGPTLICFGDRENPNKRRFEQAVRDIFSRANEKVELLWTKPSNGGVSFA